MSNDPLVMYVNILYLHSMSLLPIIRITEFLEETLLGGTTRPMLVLGENGKKYVLKIFSKKDASQRPYMVAEVIANILAREFGLNVPEAVYLRIEPDLINFLSITQKEIFNKLQEKAIDGLHFGSIYQEGYPIYSPSRDDKLLELDEFESILAFDLLIGNEDRRITKPNILRGPDHYMLIDHEKAFEGLEIMRINYNVGIMPHYFNKHLFFSKLNRIAQKNTESVSFATFEEYFRNLSLLRIEENINFLIQSGFDGESCNAWLSYLNSQKENYRNFVALLNRKIRE